MSHATHANAALTPRARLRLARLVVDQGWPTARAAERFDVSWKTSKKWAERYRSEGAAGMLDRSSAPHRQPNRTRQPCSPDRTRNGRRRSIVGVEHAEGPGRSHPKRPDLPNAGLCDFWQRASSRGLSPDFVDHSSLNLHGARLIGRLEGRHPNCVRLPGLYEPFRAIAG